jgi:radical SAM superfamily enzyme YgiQ (UPF0313 family)
MKRSLYLVNPRSEVPGYFGGESYEHLGFEPVQSIADLATTTVAAMVPDDWQVEICEEYVQPVDFEHPAEFVGVTGKITQYSRMVEVADEFRRRGKTVIIGGPFASLSPEVVRDHCDVLVIGELEGLSEELFGDLAGGSWKAEYRGPERPDLAASPLPRWDLYPNDRAVTGCVQTSRGCPFECEFCDVIQYLGRQQRHKPIPNILAELDQLYELGYRWVFLADDNLTVYRKKAKAILAAIRDWNAQRLDDPMAFTTQVSIDAARDPEIMQLMAEAGMSWVFIGIETPNEESLREAKKRQNVGIDLVDEIQVFLDYGIQVTGGMIVGFDHDGPDIFERQFEFAMSTAIPMFSLGALVAPAATPLYDRMRDGGRLLEGGSEIAGAPWDTNIRPTQMSREQLIAGLKWLCNELYSPANFGRRVLQMVERIGPQRGPFSADNRALASRPRRPVERKGLTMLKRLIRRGPEEREMWQELWRVMQEKPESEKLVMEALMRYAQVRCVYESGGFWEPHPAGAALSLGPALDSGARGLVSIGAGRSG